MCGKKCIFFRKKRNSHSFWLFIVVPYKNSVLKGFFYKAVFKQKLQGGLKSLPLFFCGEVNFRDERVYLNKSILSLTKSGWGKYK